MKRFLLYLNFMSALLRVKRLPIVTRSRWIILFQHEPGGADREARGFCIAPGIDGENRLITISAWLSQLPCLGV
jgi:hypothetical protein